MTQHMKHFPDTRDAKAALQITFGVLEFQYSGEREGYAIFKARIPGTLETIGTLFDGPDTMLFVAN